MVVEVTIDGKSVPSDSPLVTRRPFPAPSQYTGIAFGSKKLRGDVTHIYQEKTEDEAGKPVTGLHKAIVLKSKFYLLLRLLHGVVLCRCLIGPLGESLPSEGEIEESVSDPPDWTTNKEEQNNSFTT